MDDIDSVSLAIISGFRISNFCNDNNTNKFIMYLVGFSSIILRHSTQHLENMKVSIFKESHDHIQSAIIFINQFKEDNHQLQDNSLEQLKYNFLESCSILERLDKTLPTIDSFSSAINIFNKSKKDIDLLFSKILKINDQTKALESELSYILEMVFDKKIEEFTLWMKHEEINHILCGFISKYTSTEKYLDFIKNNKKIH